MFMRLMAAVVGLVFAGVANAATVIYTDRNAFYGQLGTVVIDDYENYPTGSLTSAQVTAVLDETVYRSTPHILSSSMFINASHFNAETNGWCNGCNLKTFLDFNSTSVGTGSGVFNAGFDTMSRPGGKAHEGFNGFTSSILRFRFQQLPQ